MRLHETCQEAIAECMKTKTFSIARLRSEEKTFNMHVHKCHELYFSIQGGKQFLIESESYSISPGDVFFVRALSGHCLTQVETKKHDRIVLNIHPDFLQQLSSDKTNLLLGFDAQEKHNIPRLSLSKDDQQAFLFFIQKLASITGYGEDLQEQATFIELFLLLNRNLIDQNCSCTEDNKQDFVYDKKVTEILDYINDNLDENLDLNTISQTFFISKSYLCRIFNQATGTTVNKYISARRISVAKSLLTAGESAMDACKLSGFNDYSNFHKTFTKTLGITPKKYQTVSMSQQPYTV